MCFSNGFGVGVIVAVLVGLGVGVFVAVMAIVGSFVGSTVGPVGLLLQASHPNRKSKTMRNSKVFIILISYILLSPTKVEYKK